MFTRDQSVFGSASSMRTISLIVPNAALPGDVGLGPLMSCCALATLVAAAKSIQNTVWRMIQLLSKLVRRDATVVEIIVSEIYQRSRRHEATKVTPLLP